MTTGNEADLTARARIRLAALGLFARQGFAGTSLRAIAAEAGVSHALVRHHYGSKEGLRAAVDEDVLDTFDTALDGMGVQEAGTLAELGAASAHLFGSDQVRREYLRRSLLEGGEISARLFARLLEGARDRLVALGGEVEGPAGRWAPYQVLFLILGPLVLEPVMAPGLPAPVFDPEVVAERSRAHQELIARGLLGAPRTE
ncbi:TetR/AcrR family transcriptional regulator [Nocardiopsis sp. MG754419]|uniref:TetR/AcrR family transcriptional regulator n=1 Tax=Nocardiopsis sp. MG754419 TaxID=2259865 RepID=UPI001BACF51C|nr:TetR/AcrR family transcriptional regulator [Nocardiopsis sp. MG754419]MBR8744884.1 TetR/AcrR family transcriptional regulator [Nocardiopsis sp. MG754419]